MSALLAVREGRRCVGSCTPLGKKDEAGEVVRGGMRQRMSDVLGGAWRAGGVVKRVRKELGEERDYIFEGGRIRGGEGRIGFGECALDYFLCWVDG